MRTILVLAAAAAALAGLAPIANATDFCNGNGQVSQHGSAYVAVDAVLSHGYLFSIWIYQESNGEPWLQRGGVSLQGDADVCQDSENPDFLVF